MTERPERAGGAEVALWGVGDPFAGAAPVRQVDDPGEVDGSTRMLVVDARHAADHRRELRRLSRRDVPVVVAGEVSGLRRAGDLTITRDVTGGGKGLSLPPAVDPQRVNPVGWRRWARHPAVAVIGRDDVDPTTVALVEDPDLDVKVLLGPGVDAARLPGPIADRVATRVGDETDLVDRLKRFRVLIDDASWHTDASSELLLALRALAAGTPVATSSTLLETLRLPGTAGAEGVAARARRLAEDDVERERVSVVGRRAALTDHTGRARLRAVHRELGLPVEAPVRISVVLATNRPNQLPHAVASVARQRHPDVELVAVLHGDGFDDLGPLDVAPVPTTVLRADQARTLGACLNLGVEAATGALVAKMDDDDHYGRDHLGDLALAHDYSGADMVGKRIEHIHLVDREVTLTRAQSNVERDRDHVSGPTLLASRPLLREFPFSDVPRRVDSTLHERLVDAGRRIYATHALDVVLERREGGHTWEADVDAMLADAVQVTPGLDLARTASTPDAYGES